MGPKCIITTSKPCDIPLEIHVITSIAVGTAVPLLNYILKTILPIWCSPTTNKIESSSPQHPLKWIPTIRRIDVDTERNHESTESVFLISNSILQTNNECSWQTQQICKSTAYKWKPNFTISSPASTHVILIITSDSSIVDNL